MPNRIISVVSEEKYGFMLIIGIFPILVIRRILD